MIGAIVDRALSLVSKAAAKLPKNDFFWSYIIHGKDGRTPYMTRVLFPRVFGRRIMLHRIWRPDADRELHNHPWGKAVSVVLTGGYVEERLVEVVIAEGITGTVVHVPKTKTLLRFPLSLERLDSSDFHRVSYVADGTWTLFVAGDRVQNWGFLTSRGFVAHESYFAARGLVYEGVRS